MSARRLSAAVLVCTLACATSSPEVVDPPGDATTTSSSGDDNSASTSSSAAIDLGAATGADDTGASSSSVSTSSGDTSGDSGDEVECGDGFGIRKIYGDATAVCDEPDCVRYAGIDGRDIHDDIENLPSYDGDGDNPLAELGNDVWGVALDWSGEPSMQARLALWSVDDDPWVLMEVTAFVKVVENLGDAAIQPYVYGGRHSSVSDDVRCYGGAYKPKFRLDGDVEIQKELCHSEYSTSHGALESAWPFEEGRWFGLKTVAHPVDDGVRIEMYLLSNDLGDGDVPALPACDAQEWVMLTSAVDDGWTLGTDYCEDACGTVDGTIFADGNPVDVQDGGGGISHANANTGSLRLDDVRAHVWGFSVRRIAPPDRR